jgi:hypothetical protein
MEDLELILTLSVTGLVMGLEALALWHVFRTYTPKDVEDLAIRLGMQRRRKPPEELWVDRCTR